MKLEYARLVVEGLKEAGINFVATLPATQLHTLQKLCREEPSFLHVGVTNEGEGVALCAGAWLGGRRPAMIMETSGILVATYALMRCNATFGIPVLLLSTYRGGLGEQEWYAVGTGATLTPLLSAMRIPWVVVQQPGEIGPAIREAQRSLQASLYPVSIVLGGRLTRS